MRWNIRCYRAIRTIRVVLSRHEEASTLARNDYEGILQPICIRPSCVFPFVCSSSCRSCCQFDRISLIEREIITATANVGEQIRCRIIVERGFWRNDEILENRNKDCA